MGMTSLVYGIAIALVGEMLGYEIGCEVASRRMLEIIRTVCKALADLDIEVDEENGNGDE